MKNLSRFNANRKASNQGMTQVMIGEVMADVANGSIEKLRGFTTTDGFLYTNPSKGPLLFLVDSKGNFWPCAKYLTK